MKNDYWTECIANAFDEAGIAATPAQIENVAGCVEVGHENYDMAHGHDVIQPSVETDKDRKISALKAEVANLESDLLIYRKSVAARHNIDEANVYLERHGPGRGDV